MERYIKLLFVALFATMSFALTSCGDDNDEPDDPNNNSAAFTYNGEKLYTRDSGTFDNIKIDDMMQMGFALYKTPDLFSGNDDDVDLYPVVSVTLEIKPFDVTSTSKGAKLEVITSRYTWIEDYSKCNYIEDYSNVEYYFKPTAGEVTFEGYDSNNNTVNIKVNLTMANPSKSVTLKGSVVCAYDANSYVSSEYGGGDYPY